ncbi:MAG: SDR family oxidoreductase [Candidatus Sumerlaeaceae bacterium]|nr:SDR family oxidoreductase [Candidatus Sumerlaeaceae bacterium]
MRILVTGASGHLGFHLVRYLERVGSGAEKDRLELVAAFGKTPVSCEFANAKSLELRNPDACRGLLNEFQPTHIVHAAAMANTTECEQNPELAAAVNTDGTRNLLEAAAALKSKPHFSLISTDLVFDGAKGNYSEVDNTNPLMVYGRTKLEGERIASSSGLPLAILRSALIFGPLDRERPSFLYWLLEGIKGRAVTLFDDEFRTPVYVEDLCSGIWSAMQQEVTGIVHLAGAERRSRYNFALLVAEVFGIPTEHVVRGLLADAKLPFQRPVDVSMNISQARRILGFAPLSNRSALEIIRDSV